MPRIYGDPIPEPSKLYTSFGGFPITQYAIHKYSQRSISIVLDHLNVCEHGPTCKRCCYIYNGPRRLKQHSGKTTTSYVLCERLFPPSQHRFLATISILKLMSDVMFGQLYTTHNMHRTCNEHICGNIYHIKPTFRTNIHTVLQMIKQCEHGYWCYDCCWDWPKKPVKAIMPKIEVNFLSLVHTRVRRMIAKDILGNIIGKNDFTRVRCKNDLCVNWNHFFIESRRVNFERFNAERQQRLQLHHVGA